MKIKHLMIVSLILAILTIGAVSASEDISDDLTANNETVDEIASIDGAAPDSDDVVASADDGDVLEDVKPGDFKVKMVNKEIDLDDENKDEKTVISFYCPNGTEYERVVVKYKDYEGLDNDVRMYIGSEDIKTYKNITYGEFYGLKKIGAYDLKVYYEKWNNELSDYDEVLIGSGTLKVTGTCDKDDFGIGWNDDPYNPYDYVVNIYNFPADGTLMVYVDGYQRFSKKIDTSDESLLDIYVHLKELSITKNGKYNVSVKYVVDVTSQEVDLGYKMVDVDVDDWTADEYVRVDSEVNILIHSDQIAVVDERDSLNGTVSVYVGGKLKLTRNFNSYDGKFIITVDDLKLYNNITAGSHKVKVVYMKDGIEEHKVEKSVNFYAEAYEYFHISSSVNILDHGGYIAYVSDYDGLDGTVTVYLDGNKKLTKSFQASQEKDDYDITVDDLGIYNSPLAKHNIKIEYVKKGGEKHEAQDVIEFTARPMYDYDHTISTIEKGTLVINYLKSFTGTATLYNGVKKTNPDDPDDYEWVRGNAVGSAKFSNGVATISFGPLAKGEHVFFLGISGSDYNGMVYVNVLQNTPGLSASVSASQITVGKSVTVKFSGVKSDDTVSIYLDDKLLKDVSLRSGSVSEVISGLAVGTHKIKVYFNDDDKFYSNTFYVTVKDKITLTLKKVKVKKSAKKLVLKATLKINGKKVKGKVIKFKFNKKTLKAKTNKKGIAKVTVKKKFLKKLKVGKKVTYKATYGKVSKKVTVKVKK